MIALGIILLVIGPLVASLHVLFTIGVVLLVGVILAILGRTGRAVAGANTGGDPRALTLTAHGGPVRTPQPPAGPAPAPRRGTFTPHGSPLRGRQCWFCRRSAG